MKIDAANIIGRRRAEQARLVEQGAQFAAQLDPALGIRAVVVFGSVARGDFNVWSDIDVLVVADNLPARRLDRLGALDPRPGPVQPLAWTLAELHRELARSNPIAVEAMELGVWLRGRPDMLAPG